MRKTKSGPLHESITIRFLFRRRSWDNMTKILSIYILISSNTSVLCTFHRKISVKKLFTDWNDPDSDCKRTTIIFVTSRAWWSCPSIFRPIKNNIESSCYNWMIICRVEVKKKSFSGSHTMIYKYYTCSGRWRIELLNIFVDCSIVCCKLSISLVTHITSITNLHLDEV